MADRALARADKRLQAMVPVVSWLRRMCARDIMRAVYDGAITVEEILDDRELPWLPIDRGVDFRDLDALVRTGHAEQALRPAVLHLRSKQLKCVEAYRLTRKGREAVVELFQFDAARDRVKALEIVAAMFEIRDPDLSALRRHYEALSKE